jgi:ADP-ribose pyrophosphatase YjhB (NUDIX family)
VISSGIRALPGAFHEPMPHSEGPEPREQVNRQPTPTHTFVIVVVRQGDRFLLVHETKHGQLWYLPAGRVEPGETFVEAAYRETLEEAGLTIKLEGLLRIERVVLPGGGCRMRVFFAARLHGEGVPKSVPDQHSLEAAWFDLENIPRGSLRGDDVEEILTWVARGAPVHPLSLLVEETR